MIKTNQNESNILNIHKKVHLRSGTVPLQGSPETRIYEKKSMLLLPEPQAAQKVHMHKISPNIMKNAFKTTPRQQFLRKA